jgi:hypothetical protein
LYLSLWRTYDSKNEGVSTAYNVPYALHLYNESRKHFLQRVESQISADKVDTAYLLDAGDDDAEYIRRYREKFTINWWLLEHDVDARWQEVEAMERHKYKIQDAEVKIEQAAKNIIGD